MNNEENICLCSSGKTYKECCMPFHKGKEPNNALQLMRSRYAAYALNLPDYIIKTTHPASPHYSANKFSWKRNISHFSKNSLFQKLEVLDFKEKEPWATVTFVAHIFQGENDTTFTERSYFEKINGQWLYRGGKLAQGYTTNLIINSPLKLLPLAYYGEPILRKKADPILEITDEIKNLVEGMIETMDVCQGMGLAAPQIHHSIQLFVAPIPLENKKENVELGPIKVFINPKIVHVGEKTWQASEGCLSIPAVYGTVERPEEITVEYTTLEGTTLQEKFSGWAAKIILHEKDHLEGVLFIDHINNSP